MYTDCLLYTSKMCIRDSRRITQREKGKSKLITFIFGAVILLLAGAAILQSSTVIDKLSGRLTESLSVRTNDFIYSLKIIKSNLFIGTGLESELMFSEFNRYRICLLYTSRCV